WRRGVLEDVLNALEALTAVFRHLDVGVDLHRCRNFEEHARDTGRALSALWTLDACAGRAGRTCCARRTGRTLRALGPRRSLKSRGTSSSRCANRTLESDGACRPRGSCCAGGSRRAGSAICAGRTLKSSWTLGAILSGRTLKSVCALRSRRAVG